MALVKMTDSNQNENKNDWLPFENQSQSRQMTDVK